MTEKDKTTGQTGDACGSEIQEERKIAAMHDDGPQLDEKVAAGRSLRAEAWARFRRNKLAMIGLVMVITVVLAAVFAHVVAPYDPIKQLIWTEGASAKLAPP